MAAETLVQRLLDKDYASLKEDIGNIVQKKIAQRVVAKMKEVRAAVSAADTKAK
jgi:hypothetical protein